MYFCIDSCIAHVKQRYTCHVHVRYIITYCYIQFIYCELVLPEPYRFRVLHIHIVSVVAFNNKILEQLFKIIISLSLLVCSSSFL